MKKILALFLITGLGSISLAAQTNVSIMDPSVNPKNEVPVPGSQPDTTVVNLLVSFKVQNVDEADKAFILFGSAQDQNDIKQVVADFSNSSGTYFLSYNGKSYPVSQYQAQAEVTLTLDEEGDYSYISLYVQDINGLESNRIYFSK